MSYFQKATQYGARGGDLALARRAKQFAEMQNLARFHSLLPEGEDAPGAEGFKGAFFRVVDLISRPNYAAAGIFDTLGGTGKPGEYAMERAFREMFSGIAGLEGEKETFGDVLEQMGFAEGGKLSDLIGDNGLTRNFNPTTRGAAGLALDIFTDPLTYISAPIKGASVVVGAGGEVRFLNKAGLAARKAVFDEKMVGWRKTLNLAGDANEMSVMRAIGESSQFAARNTDATVALAKSPSTGLVEVGTALFREAGEELVESGGRGLFEKPGLRFRPLPGVDIPVKADQFVATFGRTIWKGMKKSDFGRSAVEFTEGKLQALDQVFNQVPFLARKNAKYYRDRSEWFMRRTASEHVASLEARTMMTGVHKSLWNNRDLWRGFARAVEQGTDDPAAIDAWVGMAKGVGVEDPQRFMDNWVKTFDRVGRSEVDSQLLSSADFFAHEGRYFHRVVDNFDPKVRTALTQLSARRSGRAGVSERSYRHRRLFDTWDEFEANALEKGVKEKDIVLNPFEVAKIRLTGHYEDLVTQQFLQRTHTTAGFKSSVEFGKLERELQALKDKAGVTTDAEETFLAGLSERSSTFNPDSYKTARRVEVARLLSDTQEGAAFKRIDEIVNDLGKELTEQQRLVTTAKVQAQYKQIRNARSRGEIFDLNQNIQQAKSETRVLREVRSDVLELQAGLKTANSKMVVELRVNLDDALERADELADVVRSRKGLKPGMRDEAEALMLEQSKAIKALRGSVAKFREKYSGRVVRDMDGNTIRSLQDELDLITKDMDAIAVRRKQITARKDAVRGEINQTDAVFQDLESTLSRLTDAATGTRGAIAQAKGARATAARQFAEAHPTTVKELAASDLAKFRTLRPAVRAAYLHDSLSQIDDIKHFESFLNRWGDEMNAVDTELGVLANTIATGKIFDQYGQEYIRINIKTGPRAKDTAEVDRRITFYEGENVALKEQLGTVTEAQKTANANLKSARAAGLTDDELEAFKLEKSVADRRVAEVKLEQKATSEGRRVALKERGAIPAAGGSKTFYVPQGIAQDLQNIEGTFLQNPEVAELLHVFDRFSNWFKLLVTRYFPAFHVRNAYSNVAASFIDIGMEALNPVRARQALDIIRGADGTLQVGKQNLPFHMIRQELDVLGIRTDKAMIAELTGAKQTAGDPLEKFVARGLEREGAIEKLAGVATKAYTIPGNVENHARAMHYIALRRRGFTPQDAGIQVNKFLFDYADLSPTERSVFRRAFPFFTWTRKNFERQVRNLYERPGRVATQIKIATGDRGPSGDMLPEYMRGQMSIKVQSDENGESWLTGIDLPIANIDILWAGGLGKTFREQIGLLTPLIKTPLEAGIGQEFFTGESIRGVGRVREKLGFSMNRNLPKVLKDYFELENIGTEEDPRWQANRLKLHIVTKAMFISRFVSSKVQFDDMVRQFGNGDETRGATALLKMLTGMDLRSFDLEKKERDALYNRARQLENLLVDRGIMREFSKRFIPKERREELQQGQQQQSFFGQAVGGGVGNGS